MNARYLQRILDLPLLGQLEETALARRWQQSGDQAARNALVEAHLRLVPPMARRYFRAGGSLSELIAEGNFGLLHASEKFEPDRGCRFATYATHWIRASISECAIIGSCLAMKPPRTLRNVRREHARASSLSEDHAEVRRMITERLQMKPETVDGLVGLLLQRRVSFESSHAAGRVDAGLLAQDPNPEEAMLHETERRRLEHQVRDAVATLSVRERRIVDQRLMADADAAATLLELGHEFRVSRERVRQVEMSLKQKLKTHFRALSKAGGARIPSAAA